MNLYTKMAMGLMAGTGAAAYPSDAEAMYVGPKAKGWDSLTGKFSSLMDRMERAEISDAGAKWVGPEKLNPDDAYRLSDLLDHPELYDNYQKFPSLDRTDVYPIIGGPSSWNGNNINLAVSPKGTPFGGKNNLLHEVQHVIQDIEGWGKGGSPNDIAWASSTNRPHLLKVAQEEMAAWKPATYEQFWGKEITDEGKKKYAEYLKQWNSKEGESARWLAVQQGAPRKVYQNLSGEIESRDTAARMGLTSAQRASHAPYSGQGIPLKDTITKMGVAAPVGAILAEQAAERRRMAQAEALQDAFNPVEYLSPARWGGGLINMGIDALLSTVGN